MFQMWRLDMLPLTAVSVGSLLGISSCIDLKWKKVSLKLMLLYGILGIVRAVFYPSQTILSVTLGALLGVFIMGVSKITRGGIGMGDGFILMVTGVYLGLWENLELLSGGFFLTFFYSVFLLAIKKENRKKEIPFVPFLFTYYLGMLFIKGNQI